MYFSEIPPSARKDLLKHTHPYFRLVIGVKGSYGFHYYFNGLKTGTLKPGDILLTAPNRGLLISAGDNDFEIISIIFWYNLIRFLVARGTKENQQYFFYHTSNPPPRYAQHLVQTLCLLQDSEPYQYAARRLIEALIYISDHELASDVQAKCTKSMNSYKSAMDYIRNNFHTEVNRDKISRELRITPSHVLRLFRQYSSATFEETLHIVRVQHAESLLKTTHFTINEIAYMCGYKSPNHFIRIFKKIKGLSPQKFRGLNMQSHSII